MTALFSNISSINLKLKSKLMAAFLSVALIAGITGAFGIHYSNVIGHEGYSLGAKLAPLSDAAMEIKLTATKAHLLFEEIMSGDASENINEVWQLLNETLWYCDAILKGGNNDEGHFIASEDPKVLDKVKGVKASVAAFIDSAKQRYANKDNASADQAAADERFDTEYDSFITMADEAEEFIHENMHAGLVHLENNRRHVVYVMIAVTALAVIAAVLLGFLLANAIARPLHRAVALADSMAGGDFTQKFNSQRTDELGDLGKSLDRMGDSLSQALQRISVSADKLSSSSSDMSAISAQMSQGAEQTANNANSVASATEEMSTNIGSVAAACEQAAGNIDIVATSTEEMTSTIKEISQNAGKGREITDQAVTNAQAASEKVNLLGNSANKIGTVTEVINEISEQTNLLALNATIEAARAGEAGKGFAVVANEIKELAKQTADATMEIKTQIDGVQESTQETVKQISQLTGVITDVNDIVSTISAAVEEQATTADEVANNITQASLGLQEVNENVAQSSQVATNIAEDISSVNNATQEMSNGSSQVNLSAGELSKLSEALSETVNQFKIQDGSSKA